MGPAPGASPGSASGWRRRAGSRSRSASPSRGVATLDALAAGAPGAVPRDRRETAGGLRAASDGPRCLPPAELVVDPGTVCVGDGAVRYRESWRRGADVPPDDSPLHVPWARHHAALARDYGDAEPVEPIYLRLPDALRGRQRMNILFRPCACATSARSSRSRSGPTRRPGRAPCSRASCAKPSPSVWAPSTRSADALGYLIIARYVDAWHVMNIAVDPPHQRRGIATMLIEELFERHVARRPARLHARGARLERQRHPPLRTARLQGARCPARLLHGQPRGRADHVEGPGRRTGSAS